MTDANKALADVRGWLCDNLSSGDAGKVCGMLSSVSRRINELEAENAELKKAMDFQALELGCMTDNRDVLHVENAKLRELIADTLLDPREYCEKYGIEYEGWDSANAHIDKRMIELGVGE